MDSRARLVLLWLSISLASPWLAALPPQGQPSTQTTSPAQGQNPTFRAGTNLVTVDAYPLKDGKIVEGLAANDFVVTEDGKPQKIEAFEFLRIEPTPAEAHKDPKTLAESRQQAADPHNRVFVTFLDTHHVRLGGGYYANKPLVDTLDRILAPNDLFGVMTPVMRPQDVTLGRKSDTIEGELTKYWSWGRRGSLKLLPEGELRRMCYADPPPNQRVDAIDPKPILFVPVEILERSWEEHALKALEDLSLYLGRVREARSAVIVLTDGWRQFQPDQNLVDQMTTNAQNHGGLRHLPGVAVGPGGVMSVPGTASAGQPGGQDEASCMNEMTRLARLDDRRLLRDVIDSANRNNVSYYTVNPDGLIVFDSMMGDPTNGALTQPAQPDLRTEAQKVADEVDADLSNQANRVNGMIELASNTNGIAVVNTNDIGGGLKKIVDEVSAYYLLGYYSTNTKVDSTFRHIDVKVNRPNVKVAARRGYSAEGLVTKGPKAMGAESAPVDAAFVSLSKIQLDAELYATGVVIADGLVVSMEIPSRVSTEWSAGGEVTVTATSASGEKLPPVTGKIEPGARGALVKVPLAATTGGPWRVQVAVKGAPGTLQNAAEIALSPSALLGDPVIYRGAPGARSAIRPVAGMQFYRTERLHIEWPELKPLDQRTARLLGRNGQPLAVSVNLTEREQDGHQLLAADVLLGPLAPADYVVELVVGSGGATETKVVAIRVQ